MFIIGRDKLILMCSSFFFWLNVQITYLWKSPLDIPHFLHYQFITRSFLLQWSWRLTCKFDFPWAIIFVKSNLPTLKYSIFFHSTSIFARRCLSRAFHQFQIMTIVIIYLGVVSPSMSLIVEKVMPNLEASLSYATVVCWNRCAHNISFGM